MSDKIVIVGSANVDFVIKTDRLPQVGETVTDGEFLQNYGGKGANQAVAAARAGGNVAFVGCLGDDPFADVIVENFAKDGIDTDFIFKAQDVSSGTALIMVDAGGNNYLSLAPGANYRLTPQHVNQARALIEAAGIIVLQCEITPQALAHTIDLASELGKRIMLNLAPARYVADESLAKLYLLVLNETEAAFVCGFPVETEAQVEQAAEALLAKGSQVAIITLGARGSYVAAGDLREQVPAFQVEAVDSTAAGDAYCGGLAVALVEGQSLTESIRFASAAAAITVTRLGAQPSIPTRNEIDAFLEQVPHPNGYPQ